MEEKEFISGVIMAKRGDLSEEEWSEAIEELRSTGRLIAVDHDLEELKFFPMIYRDCCTGKIIKDFTDARREYRKKKGYSPGLI